MYESEWEQEVLKRVRAMRSGVVVRDLSDRHPLYAQGHCAVLDIFERDPKTPDYSRVLYQGATWAEVLRKMMADQP